MALVFDINYPLPLTGSQAMYRFKQALIAAGWTTQSSGDGLSAFSSSGDIITSGNSGANGFANTSAWVRMQSPAGAGSRELIFQRGSSNPVWTSKYSFSAGFTGGSPNSTTPGTATDSQTLLNATTLFTTDNTYRIQIACDNAAPYGFYMFAYTFGGQFNSSITCSLVMDPLLAGSYPAADNDPMVFIFVGSSAFSVGTPGSPLGYLKKGLAGEGFVNIPWMRVALGSSPILFPGGAGNHSHSFNEVMFPVFYARDTGKTAPVGWKGVSSLMKMVGQAYVTPTLLSVSTTRDTVTVGDIALPWNGSKILT